MTPFSPPLSLSEAQLVFPEYSLSRGLTAGGQGGVFVGHHPLHGECVVKVVSPEYVVRTEREVDALRAMSEPSIIQLLDSGHANVRGDPVFFHVTPFIEGEDLAQYVSRHGSLPEAAVCALLTRMSNAILALWSCGIVHRDIKPGNILLSETEGAILIDLGMARHLRQTTLTLPWQCPGTDGYMSPEHANGERQLTAKSDVFELGIAAFFALCGEHPFYGDQARIMSGTAPPTARDRVSCSNLISDLLADMLRTRPLLRPMPEQILSILMNGLGTA